MGDSKKEKIIEAAILVFGEKGYQYATISDIASQAGISTGLLYSYFENKLDVLLSIILEFLDTLNRRNAEKCAHAAHPVDKLHAILHTFEDLLIKNQPALSMVKVLNEALPHLAAIKEKSLQKKRRAIMSENKKLLETIDSIIAEGQAMGAFDRSLNPAVMRQVLCGAIERVIYGLFYASFSGHTIGYSREDAHAAILRLIETFIRA